MYVWTGVCAPIQEPTPLLRYLAGDFADRINLLWPAPHTPFLTATAARRHLACLAASRSDQARFDLDKALTLSLKQAVRELIPDAPEGLVRALEHLGEVAWSGEAYAQLLATLADPVRRKPLRHAETIRPGDIAQLSELPQALAHPGLVGLRLSRKQVGLLLEAHDAVARHSGPEAAAAAAANWGRHGNAQALCERALLDATRDLPPHPFAGVTGPLKPLTTKAAMREAGERFRNCLGSHCIAYAVNGDNAYFEWKTGAGAMVEVFNDAAFGWRLSEVKLARNKVMPASQRAILIRDAQAIGIHVGRTYWQLRDALRAAHKPDFRLDSLQEAIDNVFED